MHFSWNPWHGCHKKSVGCKNCYMYVMDKKYGVDSSIVAKSNTMFDYPIQRCKNGTYKCKIHYLSTCFTSDFFIEEADAWRDEVWQMIKERDDIRFLVYAKRPERVKQCLPSDWGKGYKNFYLVVTCENQEMADERIPMSLDLPVVWLGIGVSPMLEKIDIKQYLCSGLINEVLVCGEGYSYDSVPLDFNWVKDLKEQCINNKTSFLFQETGNYIIVDNKKYKIPFDKQKEQAKLAKMDKKFKGNRRLDFIS